MWWRKCIPYPVFFYCSFFIHPRLGWLIPLAFEIRLETRYDQILLLPYAVPVPLIFHVLHALRELPLVVLVLDMTWKLDFYCPQKVRDRAIRVASCPVSAFTLLEGSCWKRTLSIIALRVIAQGISCLLCFFQKADVKVSRKVASQPASPAPHSQTQPFKTKQTQTTQSVNIGNVVRYIPVLCFYALSTVCVYVIFILTEDME